PVPLVLQERWARNVVLLVLTLQVSTWGHTLAGASTRDGERLHSALLELTTVLRGLRGDLRDGFDHLVSELQQERLSREEVTHVLRSQVDDNRKAIENVGEELKLVTGGGGGCPCGADGEGHTGEGGVEGGTSHATNQSGEAAHSDGHPTHTIVCPPPFLLVGAHCLALLRERTPWEAARARCHSYALSVVGVRAGARQVSGDLVVPHDMDAFKSFVASTDFSGAPSGRAWVGGSTEGWGGVWAWVDGSLMKELPWLYSQPGLEGGLLAVDSDANFHTASRRVALWPICQLR
ncbi:uncharacterized protein, partial [Procambarus clarkii]|uniref:uncharacterized protein n=1 Tax=Procambarus clarkii TaxID=6728 RepID=UPI0037443231